MSNYTIKSNKTQDIRLIPYEELEKTWTPLLAMFSRMRVGGFMEREDLLQELRIVLYKCQQNYNPALGVSFKTFLFQACHNAIATLRAFHGRTVRIPPMPVILLSKIQMEVTKNYNDIDIRERPVHITPFREVPETDTTVETILRKFKDEELLNELALQSPEARVIADYVISGRVYMKEWTNLSPKDRKEGREFLQNFLRGGNNESEFL